MKKNIMLLILIALFIAFPNSSVNAMKPGDVRSHQVCGNIELAIAKSDGELEKVDCYNSYSEAKSAMYNINNDDLVIIENGEIIDAKYAVIDYDINFNANQDLKDHGYIDVYNKSTGSQTNGNYIRSTQPDDAVVIDYDYNTKRIKVKIAGLIGWIDKYYSGISLYDVVPLAWAKSPQSYIVTDSSISHVLPGNVYGEKGNYIVGLDLKPSMLNPGTYYSYDGHYFYTNMKSMINDYRNNTYANSVNPTNPYYNYYQYLSYRTKTIYNADNINQFINLRTNNNTNSKLYNTGEAFINAQNNYGINAIIMLSVGINESGWGTSRIAQDKNNLFGLRAVDNNPYLASDGFDSPADCIEIYAYTWLSYGFVQPGDWRFKGANLGNKAEGLNVKYASTPTWGEEAAHFYYELDKMFDFQERKQNQYTIAILNNNYDAVYAKKTPNGEDIDNENSNNHSRYYKYQVADSAVVILGEEMGSDGVVWYKIQSDPTLTPNLSYTNADSKTVPKYPYNWNSHVYVSSNYFRKINDPVNSYPSQNDSQSTEPPAPVAPSEKSLDAIIGSTGYSKQNDLLSGIGIGTDSGQVVGNISNQGASEVIITDANGNNKSGKLATGDKVIVKKGTESITLTIVVSGDLTGDGEINSADLLRVRKHLLGQALDGAYRQAAYMGYSQINSANLLKLRKYLLGQESI